MAEIRNFLDANVTGKTVLLRVDFNVPLNGEQVMDDTRIMEALPTIKSIIDRGGKVLIASHLGRPDGIGYQREYSLAPVAKYLSDVLGQKVVFVGDIIGYHAQEVVASLKPGQVAMLENLRFDPREKKNDPEFAKELAGLADLFVNDAFGAAHRAHASISGVTEFLPSYAGTLMLKEFHTLKTKLDDPVRPCCAILGGSKVSDKIKIIDALIEKCDTVIIGGGMCFTFLLAQGYEVGKSLKEVDWVDRARETLERAEAKGVKILLPTDVVCAPAVAEGVEIEVAPVDQIPDYMMGLDIGPETVKEYTRAILQAKTVFWNGPMGVFELKPFEAGTKGVAVAVAAAKEATTIIGGGDSVAAVNKFNLGDQMTFISTGGGASMKLVQGDDLPGIEALK